MRFHHRKLLLVVLSFKDQNISCPKSSCHKVGKMKQNDAECPELPKHAAIPETDHPQLPPPAPLVPHLDSGDANMKHLAAVGMTILACVIVGVLLLGILCAIVRAYYLRKNNTSRRNPPIYFGTQEDFLDEDHGPELDHPIWYINTVGLPQSVIDSIAVFLYKKGEGLIEGTECSVCLNEFKEDETLRLLPKCSHAFHMPCIDTWLRSHKNCPLCRAPIVIDAVLAQARESEPSSSGLDSRNENLEENWENHGGEVSRSVGEGGTSEMSSGVDINGALAVEDVSSAENSEKFFPRLKTKNGDSDSGVLSDLADNRRVVEEDMQPMRRSVSLDSSSASKIYNAVAIAVNDKHQVSFDIQLVQHKNLKSKNVSKRSGGSSSIYRLIKSSSIGSSLQKGPISMKRSLSSGGKSSSSRHSRRHSILPLSR